MREFEIAGRKIGIEYPPFVIAEVGINHEGDINKAIQMVKDAYSSGCECVKFQCHVVEDEMIPNDVKPGHTKETIWEIMVRCALSHEEEVYLKKYVEEKGMIFMSTPFSRAAAVRLEALGVSAYKIGSGECNNYPLIKHVASYGKPIILSTGMNDLDSISPAVQILEEAELPYALTHCTSVYPTPYDAVRLGAIPILQEAFPNAVVGLSDHTLTNYTSIAAIPLGARILERHFTSDKSWPGPDINISMDPSELQELIMASRSVFQALGGEKGILPEEKPTIDFAYASVVSIQEIHKGEKLSKENIWVKRPGTGEIKAKDYEAILGKVVKNKIPLNTQIMWSDFS